MHASAGCLRVIRGRFEMTPEWIAAAMAAKCSVMKAVYVMARQRHSAHSLNVGVDRGVLGSILGLG
jgi:hypothetical protein